MKAATHRLITKTAMAQCRCNPTPTIQQALQRISRLEEAVYDGAEKEDWWPIWQRFAHWHFYRSNNDFPELHLVRQTSDLRLEQLEKQLQHPESNRHYALTLGRILHHLQDMCCPPHAVPIYHGPGSPDPLEELMESYLQQHNAALPEAAPLPCHGLTNLYQLAAESTLAYISDLENGLRVIKDGQAITLPLSSFWPRYGSSGTISEKGFAHYGPFGKLWGKSDISLGSSHYQIPQSEYQRITVELYSRTATVTRQGIELMLASYPML